MRLLFKLDTSEEFATLAIGSTLYFEITDLLAPANTKALNCWDFMILKCEPDDTVASCKAADRIVELA